VLVAFAAAEPFAVLRRGALEFGRTLLAAGRIAPRLSAVEADFAPKAPAHELAFALQNVTVIHDGAALPALRNVTLEVSRGEHIAVIGSSGAGKSTLLLLLAGELPPASGMAAALDGTLLTQRTELFQDTLRGNLVLAAPDADDDRLRDALAAAGLIDDVDALPSGLDTLLGEGGMGLSGGQSRRLALARLFLRDTPLWLLDEPTEGLDGRTARDVLHRLAVEAEGRSLLIATHIRREAALADRIVVVDGGRITEVSRRGEAAFEKALDRLRPD